MLFGLTRTYKYSMINETSGRSIITVLQSKYDVINFALLYIPLGKMSLNIILTYYIEILPVIKNWGIVSLLIELITSNKAVAFGVFQQSLLYPNERINVGHGRFDIFMGVFKEELTGLIWFIRQ